MHAVYASLQRGICMSLTRLPGSEQIYNNCTLQSKGAGLVHGVMTYWHFSQAANMYNWILFFISDPAVKNKP